MTRAETPHAELLCGRGFWGDTMQVGASLVGERRDACSPACAHSVQQTRAPCSPLHVACSTIGAAIALASLAWAVWPWVPCSQCVATQRDAVTGGDSTGGKELSLLWVCPPPPLPPSAPSQAALPSTSGLSQAMETPSALPHSSAGVGRSRAVSQRL